ncbi:sensor histidine kinase [Lapillicoccus jejuensis]|uniref:histidine kinase n=1 Tax=Lapillicoccus jejuensis TaxID=402171 RepID=A0A542E3T2_9MICO|nr:HAMP domain-containing sensor histidine kinase [Lapillicoccus jejuensis]TQJ09991.1 signal transduction histidine kinase [Lapillicoccus jejuensis]
MRSVRRRAPSAGSRLHTPSLRRRVTATVLLLLTVMVAVLGVTTDVVLRNRLESQLEQRLQDRAQLGVALADQIPDIEALAERLEGNGVSVKVVNAAGQVAVKGPPIGPQPGRGPGGGPAGRNGADTAPGGSGASSDSTGSRGSSGSDGSGTSTQLPPQSADGVVVHYDNVVQESRKLPDGTWLTLQADSGEVDRVVDQTRIAFLAGAIGVLLLGAAVVRPVVGRVLRPLDRITSVARSIGKGDRGRRLRPDRPRTELGTTAQAFDDMLDAVEGAERHALESEQRLRDFLSDAAHELRTPIAGVQASAEHVLRSDPERAERERTLLALVRESRRAGRLVDDLLLMARIDRGLPLAPQPVELRSLVAGAVESRRLRHPDTALLVTGDDVVVDADPDRVTQVVGNLLDNAVRAAGRTARVHVAVRRTDAGEAVVEVTDDGPGIAPADRERVFERMVRLDAARTPGDSGAGLGLPIARGIARAHGGDLVCVPREAGDTALPGARFRLTLPLTPTAASAARGHRSPVGADVPLVARSGPPAAARAGTPAP